MRKIIPILFIIFYNIQYVFSVTYSKVEKNDIIPGGTVALNQKEKTESIFSIFEYIRDSIWGLLALITITVFIWIGAKIILARGNPEEFKKALMHFIYAIVGLAIIALAWAVIRMASSLNF